MSQRDPLQQSNNNNTLQSRNTEAMARSAGIPPRLRNDESWVEISSQPSSSSLSSIGDEIVTTGLRVQNDPNIRRRRRVPGAPSHLQEARQASTSSQEEYEESESEEDQVMTSSNENIVQSTRISDPKAEYDAESDSDDDENATALGRRTDPGPVFTPQPNAFSHPPSSHRASAPNSYFPPNASNHRRTSYPPARNVSRQHFYNNAADHDAALRASLTTLLSFQTAAARGLPKREERRTMSNQPMGLAFVPESELMGPSPVPNSSRPLSPSTRARSSPSISSQEAVVEKGKRKAIATKTVEKVRATKKKRIETEDKILPPTLLTWVMSAGVIILVSVVGFGAGYVIGREAGRQEVMAGLNGSSIIDPGSCGKEAVRGGTGTLRRFRLGFGGGSRGIMA